MLKRGEDGENFFVGQKPPSFLGKKGLSKKIQVIEMAIDVEGNRIGRSLGDQFCLIVKMAFYGLLNVFCTPMIKGHHYEGESDEECCGTPKDILIIR